MNKLIYLGMLVTMCNFSAAAENVVLNPQSNQEIYSSNETLLESINSKTINKPKISLETNEEVIKVIAPLSSNYKKPIEEKIEEGLLITEYQMETIQPLYLGLTLEQTIEFKAQIIESDYNNEVYPLDFEIINKNYNALKFNEAYENKNNY